jgi:hypothetical protein
MHDGSNAMSAEEALRLIEESRKFLEPYRIYGKMISDGIAQLNELEKQVRQLKYEDAFKMSSGMCEQIAGYRSYAPQLVDNLERIRDILGKLA